MTNRLQLQFEADKEAMFRLIQDRTDVANSLTTKEVAAQLSVTQDKARRGLRQLQEEGRINGKMIKQRIKSFNHGTANQHIKVWWR